ncbi:TetR family transcriptional regulator [bacterium]|nr:TetR family transcriptional regulator [bacterium]
MGSQDEKTGRVNQKQRTRSELLRAAGELAAQGLKPTVAEVADHAGISRATAYRYFSTPEDILREAVLDVIARAIEPHPRPAGADPADTEAALADLVAQVFDMVTRNEPMFRAMLAGSLDKGARRGGRRQVWIADVLAPLRPGMAPERFDRLVYSLCLLTGIETLVVLKDVCGLDGTRAQDVTLWAARTLLAGAAREEG